MGKPMRARLKDRERGKVSPQFHARLEGMRVNVLFAGLASVWLVYLAGTMLAVHWTDAADDGFIAASAVAGAIFAWNLIRIQRFRSCELGNSVFVTPLYLIRTHFDQIRYYPIWEIKEVAPRAGRRLEWRRSRVLVVKLQTREETIRFSSRAKADSFNEAVRLFNQKVQAAKEAKDLSFFAYEDDFREPPPQDTKIRRLDLPVMVGWAILALAVFLGGTIGMEYYNDYLGRPVQRVAISAVASGDLSPTTAKGAGVKVDFETDPAGAVVQENGAVLGRTPLRLAGAKATKHTYLLQYSDWPPVTTEVDLTAGPRLVKYSWPHGTVRLDTTPEGAKVSANGQSLGMTPLVLAAVPPGHVDYALSLDGFASVELLGNVENGKSLALSAKLVDNFHQGSIRLKLGSDRTHVVVTNLGDKSVSLLSGNLYDADYTLKDSIVGPWTIAPGGAVTLVFHQARSDFDFYSFRSEPKNLAIEIVK